MGYVYLVIVLVIGGLYEANKMCRAELTTAHQETAGVRAQLDDVAAVADREEQARSKQFADLQAAQAAAAAAQRARAAAALQAAKAAATARYAQLKESLHGYVTAAADSRCAVPVGFVLWHDAAASGVGADQAGAALSAAAGRSVDADSGIRLSAVANAVGANYAADDAAISECTTEVKAWRDWYPAEAQRFAAP